MSLRTSGHTRTPHPHTLFVGLLFWLLAQAALAQPLPSWNEGPSKQAIIDFVTNVTTPGSPKFVPPPKRIAVFDNDGTLWCEQPYPVQFAFAIDRVRELAPQHPEWQNDPALAAVINGDISAFVATGEQGLMRVLAVTHAGMTTDEFTKIVSDWLATAKHPRFQRPYTQVVYQPMLELLSFLRDKGFKTFIVSGGGAEFMRVFSEKVYGIPPEQVVGSTGVLKFEYDPDGKPLLRRLPEVDFVNNKAGKPVAIERFIGRQPIFAFGNSDGDKEMLEWTEANPRAHFAGLVHHTDAAREYAYDTGLDVAFKEAQAKGWTVVDMKSDWRQVFPSR